MIVDNRIKPGDLYLSNLDRYLVFIIGQSPDDQQVDQCRILYDCLLILEPKLFEATDIDKLESVSDRFLERGKLFLDSATILSR